MKAKLLIGCLLLGLAAFAAGCVVTTEKPADSSPPPVPPPPPPAPTPAPIAAEAPPADEPAPVPTAAGSVAPSASEEIDAGAPPAWNRKSETSPQRDAGVATDGGN
jgi:hypothetical protein